MQKLFSAVVIAFAALLGACGGGAGGDAAGIVSSAANATNAQQTISSGYPGEPLSCSVADQRAWLNDYMADQYFWNANLAAPNASATSLDAYFGSLLFVPTDRYSFTQDSAQFTQFFTEGTRTGFGYSLAFTDATQSALQVRSVESAGPAAAAGLKRGDTVLSIDGLGPASIAKGELRTVNTSGITRTFSLADASGAPRTVTMVSRNFPLASVVSDKILTSASGEKVGYLAYQEFSPSSVTALGVVFNRFRDAGVTELIVDLRYNGGGSVLVARTLASLIGGAGLDGQVFAKVRFNAKNTDSNFDYRFTASPMALPAAPLEGLTQVFFITSPNTASASELVINALAPFKKIINIGAATFGKPYGFQPRSACSTVYSAVNFELFNAVDVGRYTSGLPATCNVSDDLSKALGDPTERRTAAALGFIQTKACPVVAAGVQSNKPADQSIRAQKATDLIAEPRWLEPAFGEVAVPAMVMD
jgi:carboxyl-terminal processing protease